ncbi:response regulator transcription factor [Mucilaginibacter sp. NFX135]|jgi:DNA-binding NarL/FixJ family response regulator|uniref:response regulator transcription factor n=1 Tax=Mucilaginibacter sp. NFX135 TaxID=3402687 RepID=UPI003AFA5C51
MQRDPIKVAIVDDHTLFRNGVAGLMNEFPEIDVLFEGANGQQLQMLLQKHPLPDVILMDINMPVIDGYTATAWLKANHPTVKVLALSMFEDDKAVLKMIRSGACGYVLKEASPLELLEAIKTVDLKGVYINELVTGKLMRSVRNPSEDAGLTAKETEFLKLCCSELTYKEMADQLFVSPRTVDNYRESLFLKLRLKSRSGLILFAIQNEIFKF